MLLLAGKLFFVVVVFLVVWGSSGVFCCLFGDVFVILCFFCLSRVFFGCFGGGVFLLFRHPSYAPPAPNNQKTTFPHAKRQKNTLPGASRECWVSRQNARTLRSTRELHFQQKRFTPELDFKPDVKRLHSRARITGI